MRYGFLLRICTALVLGGLPAAANPPAPLSYPGPDPRYKADLLLVVAHPDDETALGAFLCRTVLDEGRRVAVVYTNRGSGGGNSAGVEQSRALGAEREIEVRRALSELEIHLVWFLDGRDTPGQDVFASLDNLPHGAALEKLVRLIRLTRPEVICTWLPQVVAGENHGDHQAAGVLATEAFDLAGDPTSFPVQVTPPREPGDINNVSEGLWPWQPKKLYFFSDADRTLEGPGPAFDLRAVSPSRGVPYYRLAARLQEHHRTQGDVARMAAEARTSGDWEPLLAYLSRFRLLFGKTVTGGQPDEPVFAGITKASVPFQPAPGYRPEEGSGVDFRFGGAFHYYRRFWKAHGIEHLEGLVEPELMVAAGSYVHVPLLIRNFTDREVRVLIERSLPEGWTALQADLEISVPAGVEVPVQTFYFAPGEPVRETRRLSWTARQGNRTLGVLNLKVDIRDWTLPQ